MPGVTFVRCEILNRARIIKGQSYVIISNHQSHFDILAIVDKTRKAIIENFNPSF
ncbi:MAG: hypothetical protein MUD12_13615 [Spirochaetes bacterium]|jgi:1-acyl-sn-glycerol-3-phosphate acyltransferase|nr:hypothetical protein [Spirochaetota bacterium]